MPVAFCSGNEDDEELRMADVAGASSAAPTYFPAKQLLHRGQMRCFVDGGLVANNPSLYALLHALKKNQLEEIFFVTIGTGINGGKGIATTQEGKIQWASKVLWFAWY